MFIAHTDKQTGKTVVENLTGEMPVEQLAAREGWLNWRIISEQEAAELQKPTPEEQLVAMQKQFTDAIQARLDAFAKTRNWDNVYTCVARINSKNPQYKLEAEYMLEAMDDTWDAAIAVLNAVLADERPMPTLEDVFAELPILAWPDEATPDDEPEPEDVAQPS